MPIEQRVFLARAIRHVDEIDGLGLHGASPLGRVRVAA
jgi:hypothetical protein